jgi:hypothetical protein
MSSPTIQNPSPKDMLRTEDVAGSTTEGVVVTDGWAGVAGCAMLEAIR